MFLDHGFQQDPEFRGCKVFGELFARPEAGMVQGRGGVVGREMTESEPCAELADNPHNGLGTCGASAMVERVHKIPAQDWCDGLRLDYFPCAAESCELARVQCNLGQGSGHKIACFLGLQTFAHAGLDGTRDRGMVSGISPAVGGAPIMLVVRDTFLSRVRIVIRAVWVGDTVYLGAGKVH